MLLGDDAAWFRSSLSPKPYVKTGKASPQQIAQREEIDGYPLIEINHPSWIKWIPVDIDCPQMVGSGSTDSVLAWERIGIPPTIMIVNPRNTHAHFLYALAKPVRLSDDASPSKAVGFYYAVKNALTRGLGGDSAFCGKFCKNPLNPSWQSRIVLKRAYTLGDLSKHLDLRYVPRSDVAYGRNCSLFNRLSTWARRHKRHFVRQGANAYEFEQACQRMLAEFQDEAISSNDSTFAQGPLSPSECRHIAVSVSRWVWHRYRGNGVDRGVVNIPAGASLRDSQRLGQAYSAGIKSNRTRDRILKSVDLIRMAGEPLSRIRVAEISGVSYATVRRHWPSLSAHVDQVRIASCSPPFPLPIPDDTE